MCFSLPVSFEALSFAFVCSIGGYLQSKREEVVFGINDAEPTRKIWSKLCSSLMVPAVSVCNEGLKSSTPLTNERV